MAETLWVNEVYLSLQGESTWAGLPCVFVRLAGCPLRCSYCDTAYAFRNGKHWSFEAIRLRVSELSAPYQNARVSGGFPLPIVEFTGGEPLSQPASKELMAQFCAAGSVVLVETSGAVSIEGMDPRIRRIMDLKCPSSGEVDRNRWENLKDLRETDELKFVIATREDYEWSAAQVREHRLETRCPVLFSWAAPLAAEQRDATLKRMPEGMTLWSRQQLVEAIVADALPVRFQLQMHKYVWAPEQRGV